MILLLLKYVNPVPGSDTPIVGEAVCRRVAFLVRRSSISIFFFYSRRRKAKTRRQASARRKAKQLHRRKTAYLLFIKQYVTRINRMAPKQITHISWFDLTAIVPCHRITAVSSIFSLQDK